LVRLPVCLPRKPTVDQTAVLARPTTSSSKIVDKAFYSSWSSGPSSPLRDQVIDGFRADGIEELAWVIPAIFNAATIPTDSVQRTHYLQLFESLSSRKLDSQE
jgi:hypothetical protein